MTRINCVPASELHNKHLLIEYRELPRVFRLAVPAYDIPKSYRMGTGHVKFFYDKLGYLVKRQQQLIDELKSRGYNITYDSQGLLTLNPFKQLYNDWTPTERDMHINRMRLQVSADRSKSISANYI